MFRSAMLVAVISGCVVSTSFGGFVVSATRTSSADPSLDQIDIYARNTGGDTGTGLLAVEMASATTAGEAVWRSTSAGNWSPTNPADIAIRSFVRIDSEDVSSTSLVSKTPAANQPLAPAYGPFTVALDDFGVAIAGLSGVVPAETGNGALFARLFVSKNFSSTISGNVRGSAGPMVGFSLGHGGGISIHPTPPTNVVFNNSTGGKAPFSVLIDVSVGARSSLNLTVADVPGISNIVVTDVYATPFETFNVTGLVDSSLIGSTVVVQFSVSGGGPPAFSSFRLIVTPEPTMLSLLAASGFVRRRR